MPRFLAVYMGTMDGEKRAEWNALDPATQQARAAAGMQAWGAWVAAHSGAIIDQGGPLGKTKLADKNGISDTKNLMTGYVIVEADSHEAAARMFEGHAHFMHMPGDSIEIVEILPMPQR